MKLLENKTVIITGGAGLIGQNFCKAVLEHGANCIIADINMESAQRVIETLDADPQKIRFVETDITNKDSIVNLITESVKTFGKIDALVNNAYPRNKNYGRKFEKVEYQDFCENVNLHLGGYFLMCQQFAEYFKQNGTGNIVNVSSIYGVIAPRFEVYENTEMTMPVEYSVIKSGLIHLTKYLVKYYKGNSIRFNCLSPGGIENGQNPEFLMKYNHFAQSKGMLAPSDLIGTLVYLLSDLSLYVNGQNIIIDDGWSL